jgi:hypothetical protein
MEEGGGILAGVFGEGPSICRFPALPCLSYVPCPFLLSLSPVHVLPYPQGSCPDCPPRGAPSPPCPSCSPPALPAPPTLHLPPCPSPPILRTGVLFTIRLARGRRRAAWAGQRNAAGAWALCAFGVMRFRGSMSARMVPHARAMLCQHTRGQGRGVTAHSQRQRLATCSQLPWGSRRRAWGSTWAEGWLRVPPPSIIQQVVGWLVGRFVLPPPPPPREDWGDTCR